MANKTETQSLDPATQAMQTDLYALARRAAGLGGVMGPNGQVTLGGIPDDVQKRAAQIDKISPGAGASLLQQYQQKQANTYMPGTTAGGAPQGGGGGGGGGNLGLPGGGPQVNTMTASAGATTGGAAPGAPAGGMPNWAGGASQSPFGQVPGTANPVPGVNPMSLQAGQNFFNAGQAGNLGLGALAGDQGAMQQLLNPYMQNVLGTVNQQFGDMRTQASNQLNDQATQAGAFGGSRHGIAQGQMLADMGKNQMGQIANLAYGGFNDAMGRAGSLAQMGQQASGQMHGLGEYARQVTQQQDPIMHQMAILQGAMGGTPYGSTSRVSTSGGGNGFGQALGGAATLAGLFA